MKSPLSRTVGIFIFIMVSSIYLLRHLITETVSDFAEVTYPTSHAFLSGGEKNSRILAKQLSLFTFIPPEGSITICYLRPSLPTSR